MWWLKNDDTTTNSGKDGSSHSKAITLDRPTLIVYLAQRLSGFFNNVKRSNICFNWWFCSKKMKVWRKTREDHHWFITLKEYYILVLKSVVSRNENWCWFFVPISILVPVGFQYTGCLNKCIHNINEWTL